MTPGSAVGYALWGPLYISFIIKTCQIRLCILIFSVMCSFKENIFFQTRKNYYYGKYSKIRTLSFSVLK